MPQIKKYRQPRALSFPTAAVLGRRKARVPNGKWDEHPSVWVAFDHWVRKHRCHGCEACDQMGRVSRLRRAYGRKRSWS